MQTEAEELDFDLEGLPLPFLGKKGAQKVVTLLKDDIFGFLGPWRANTTLIQKMNMHIVSGTQSLVDGFLHDGFVDKLYNEILAYSKTDKFHLNGFGLDIGKTGLDMKAYHKAWDPAKRCNLLYRGIHDGSLMRDDGSFHHRLNHFSFNDLEGNGEDYPAIKLMHYGMQNLKWMQAMNLLLTGSGKRIRAKPELRVQKKFPFFREFKMGDYALLHTDMAPNEQGDTRGLSINGWLGTPGWKAEWGGNFLWCGGHLAKDANGKLFSDAERTLPGYNQAGFFLPHNETWHAVELVEDSKPSDFRRFSFKFDYEIYNLEGPQPGELKHSDVLVKKQAALRKEGGAFAVRDKLRGAETTVEVSSTASTTVIHETETSEEEKVEEKSSKYEKRRTSQKKKESVEDESEEGTSKPWSFGRPSNNKVAPITLDQEMEQMLNKFQLQFTTQKADDLTIKEIPQLLEDYQRLAKFFTQVRQQAKNSEIV